MGWLNAPGLEPGYAVTMSTLHAAVHIRVRERALDYGDDETPGKGHS